MEEAPNSDPKDDLLELEFEPNGGSTDNPGKITKGARSISQEQPYQRAWKASSLQKSQLNVASLSGYFKEDPKYFSSIEVKQLPVARMDISSVYSPGLSVQTAQVQSRETLPPIKAVFPSLKVCKHTQLSDSLEALRVKHPKPEKIEPGPRTQIVTNMINLFSKIRPMMQIETIKDVKRNQRSVKVHKYPKLNESRLQPVSKGPQELQVLPITELPPQKVNTSLNLASNRDKRALKNVPDGVSELGNFFDKDTYPTANTEQTQQSAREKHEVLKKFYKNCFVKRPKLRNHFPSASLAHKVSQDIPQRSKSPEGRYPARADRDALPGLQSRSPSPNSPVNLNFDPRSDSQQLSQSSLPPDRPLLACQSLDTGIVQSAIIGHLDSQKLTPLLPMKQATKLLPQPVRRLQRSTHLFVTVPPGRQTLRPLAALLQARQGTTQDDAS